MNDWIDRKEVLEAIEDDASTGLYSCFASYKDAQKFKKRIETINSRAHGEWTKRRLDDDTKFFMPRCSKCDAMMPYRFNFCPNCGADMREVQHE